MGSDGNRHHDSKQVVPGPGQPENSNGVMVMEIPDEQKNVAETARGVLEKLLGLLEITASVAPSAQFPMSDEDEAAASIAFDVKGKDLGILIGRRGETLASLQYLVRLIASQQTQTRLPIIVDVEGYKRRHWEGLQSLAWRIAEQVKLRKTPFALEPMPAFERRIIHLALANNPDVITESTGQGETRKVVIMPRNRLNI
ncbi:MAG: KH domain-containing protein [Chloroflexi bacterium]|nr:KH domain-containing protein [Chloroflexota bacterium]